MNRILNANWKFVVDKLGTILVDRRFWEMFIFPTIFSLGLLPYLQDKDVVQLSEEAVAWAALLVPIISSFLLGISWTKRAPSGLGFKDVKTESDVLAEAVIKAIKEQ